MTKMLEQAFAQASKLSEQEQDVLAKRLLAELADDDDFDHAISATASKLSGLAREALRDHDYG